MTKKGKLNTKAEYIDQYILPLISCKRQKAELFFFETETAMAKKFDKHFVGIHFREWQTFADLPKIRKIRKN